jgi:hypothetical protein
VGGSTRQLSRVALLALACSGDTHDAAMLAQGAARAIDVDVHCK